MSPALYPLVAALLLFAPFPAAAEQEPAADTPDNSRRALYKTATYQSMSSFNDFTFATMIARAGAAGGGVLAGLSLVTEPIVYYFHESAWSAARDATGQTEIEALPAKTMSYAAVNSGRVFLSGLLVTGSPLFALGFTAFNAVGDALTSAGNDAAWAYLSPETPPRPEPSTSAGPFLVAKP